MIRMRSGCVLFCLLVVMASCTKGPTTPAAVDRTVVLAPGQSVNIIEASITLRFERVSGDSRCPADAICIQGGDALVRIEVIPSRGARRTHELHTGDMRPVIHDDLTIGLVELAPYPFSSRTIQPDEYQATLRVTR
jgi:hypothetical protein